MTAKLPPGVTQRSTGTYEARYRDRWGKRHSATFPTITAAKAWRADQLTDVRRGTHHDPRAGRILVKDWHTQWWQARVVERTTLAGDKSRLTKHVIPEFGDLQLGQVTRLQIQAWVQQLSRTLAPDTTRKCYHLLARMLDDARREGLIIVNPATDVDLPRIPPGREVFLTKAEVAAIVAEAVEPYATVFHTLAYTGLRWGELAGMRVDQLDMLRGRLRVDGVMTRYGPKAYPKGGSRRTVPMPEHLVDRLAQHLTMFPADRDRLVFTGPRGGALQDGHVRSRHWNPAVKAAKITTSPHLHDCRHSYASWLIQDGVPLAVVQRLLGHASSRTSERYTHLAPDYDDGVVGSLTAPIPDVHKSTTSL